MLSLKNVRFEIPPRSHRARFQYGFTTRRSKNFIRPKRLWQNHSFAFNFRFRNAKIGRNQEIPFVKQAFCFKENRLLENLTAMQNIAIFMDNPNEHEIIALAEKIGLSSGDLK